MKILNLEAYTVGTPAISAIHIDPETLSAEAIGADNTTYTTVSELLDAHDIDALDLGAWLFEHGQDEGAKAFAQAIASDMLAFYRTSGLVPLQTAGGIQ